MLPVCFRCFRSNFHHKHTRIKKLGKPRKSSGFEANQRARIIQVSELESCRSQDLNHANSRKENLGTVRETVAALVHLQPRRPSPISLFCSGSTSLANATQAASVAALMMPAAYLSIDVDRRRMAYEGPARLQPSRSECC